MKPVGTRLGEDVDPPEPEPVVFGRERILIDSDLANRVLGREFAAAESIYVQGTAVRSRSGTGEGLEIGCQIVGIVRKRVQIGAAQDNCTRVRCGLGTDAGSAAVLHSYSLLLRRHIEQKIQRL